MPLTEGAAGPSGTPAGLGEVSEGLKDPLWGESLATGSD